VPLEQLREAGLRAQRGGVGFYPTSGAPFVHMDTGSVRHWPRMPEAQLASVMAKGQLHSQPVFDTTQRSRMPGLLARLFGGRDEANETPAAPAKGATTALKPARAPNARGARRPAIAAAPERARKKLAFVPSPPPNPAKSMEQPAAAAKPVPAYQLASAASEPAFTPATYEIASGAIQP